MFDEATSALDDATEKAVMDAIEKLDRDITVLFIAHRLTTLRNCDRIIELKDGLVLNDERYEKMLADGQRCARVFPDEWCLQLETWS